VFVEIEEKNKDKMSSNRINGLGSFLFIGNNEA